MEIFPLVSADRFSKIAPGEFCIVSLSGATFACLKAIDPKSDNDPLMVLLGPDLPPEWAPGQVLQAESTSALRFGDGAYVRLSAEPKDWSSTPPDASKLALVVIENAAYLRGRYAQSLHRSINALIALKDGKVAFGSLPDSAWYVAKWSIVYKVANGDPQTIMEFGTKANSA